MFTKLNMAAKQHSVTRDYKCYQRLLIAVCIIGILVSWYAYHVETSKERDSGYIAFCDINSYISCSKAFTSRFGKGFGLLEHIVGRNHWINQPNSLFGIIFYVLQLILDRFHKPHIAKLQVLLSVVANLGSVYLASILYFVLYDFCIVCAAMYVVNFILIVINILRYKLITRVVEQRRVTKKTI